MPQAHGHRQAEPHLKVQKSSRTNGLFSELDRKVWFTDEAHFYLNGAVNHHNNVYLGDERPK